MSQQRKVSSFTTKMMIEPLLWTVDGCHAEILEYCKVLGMDPVAEEDLLYIAREGIKAPLPKNWKPM